MNERIKQLAEQAGFKVNWQHEDVQAIKTARYEKFAELIINECLFFMAQGDVDFAKWQIKKEFGVEV